MKTLICPALILVVICSAIGQTPAPRTGASSTPRPAAGGGDVALRPDPAAEEVPRQMAAEFFALLEKGQIDDAYAKLTKGSKTIEKPEDLRILKQKTKEAIDVFGAVVGHELVETKTVGTRLMRQTYLSLGVEFPLRWRFYFYQANNRWRLIDLRVDDRLAGMFDEPAEAPDARTSRP
jgi:hypothetical protein